LHTFVYDQFPGASVLTTTATIVALNTECTTLCSYVNQAIYLPVDSNMSNNVLTT